MKKGHKYLAVILGLIFSCSSSGDDTLDQQTVNKAPTIPKQVYPLNNTLCINNAIDFQWDASNDADDDPISYTVEISENSNFSNLTQTRTVNTTTTNILLEKGKSFYWRVKALDSRDEESGFSLVSQFLTEGDGVSNHLPFVAQLIAPRIDEVINGTSAALSWTASDADNDALTFDVYLDTVNSPATKVSENQTETTYSATSLTAATTYYFKVVVKDAHGGVTLGQIWSFKTQ